MEEFVNTEFVQELKVLSTQTDHTTSVGVMQAVSLMQDNMCEYFKNLHCDGPSLIPDYNSFFVLCKTKLRMVEQPKWLQKIKLKTGLLSLSKLRINVCHNFEDLNGNLMIEGLQELCPIYFDTRRVREIASVPYPTDAEPNLDYVNQIKFEKFNEELDNEYLVDKIKINTNNIDFYGHTNNIEYVKFLISVIPSTEFYKMKIKEFEIHYIRETRERDVIDVFCKKSNGDYYYVMKNGDVVVCKARLLFDINE
jgi:acyl-ACP thioesterase